MTLEELIKEAVREGNMRRAVYPKAEGKPETKEHRLRAMDAIERLLRAVSTSPHRAELEKAANIDQPQPSLF